jgi:hypothetical protein
LFPITQLINYTIACSAHLLNQSTQLRTNNYLLPELNPAPDSPVRDKMFIVKNDHTISVPSGTGCLVCKKHTEAAGVQSLYGLQASHKGDALHFVPRGTIDFGAILWL